MPRSYVSEVRAAGAQKTRARLVHAARAILRSKAELTIDAVAERAGVSRMTVYNQFGSKRGLVEAIADDSAMRGGLARVTEAFGSDDPLRLVVEIFVHFWATEYQIVRALRARGRLDPEISSAMRDERRKAIVRRFVRGDISDVIVALTSFETYETLRAGRNEEEVVELISSACRKLLA